jgi:lysozyme family protein
MQTNDIQTVIKKYQDVRLDYYKQLKTFETFGRGWTRRVEETTQMAMKLI